MLVHDLCRHPGREGLVGPVCGGTLEAPHRRPVQMEMSSRLRLLLLCHLESEGTHVGRAPATHVPSDFLPRAAASLIDSPDIRVLWTQHDLEELFNYF